MSSNLKCTRYRGSGEIASNVRGRTSLTSVSLKNKSCKNPAAAPGKQKYVLEKKREGVALSPELILSALGTCKQNVMGQKWFLPLGSFVFNWITFPRGIHTCKQCFDVIILYFNLRFDSPVPIYLTTI